MARKISMRQALNEALDQEMTRDPAVIVMGEDIVGGMGGEGEKDAWGGVLGVTKGLYAKYGERLLDTPLSESAYIGAAIGAAACGMRPVAELMFIDFMGVCFDEIFNQAAKFRSKARRTARRLPTSLPIRSKKTPICKASGSTCRHREFCPMIMRSFVWRGNRDETAAVLTATNAS